MTHGQQKLIVHGRRGIEEGNRLIGESIMFSREQKISATMACPNCSSEPVGLTLNPTSINNVIGTSWSLSAQVTYLDNSTCGFFRPARSHQIHSAHGDGRPCGGYI